MHNAHTNTHTNAHTHTSAHTHECTQTSINACHTHARRARTVNHGSEYWYMGSTSVRSVMEK